MAETEGNADEALKAFGGDVGFKPMNHEAGTPWKSDGGNDEAALESWGGVHQGGKTSSILRHSSDVEMPGVRDDAPKADNKQPY